MLEGSNTSNANFTRIQPLKQINTGGAGTIWTIKNHPQYVLKLYHDTVDIKQYEKK